MYDAAWRPRDWHRHRHHGLPRRARDGPCTRRVHVVSSGVRSGSRPQGALSRDGGRSWTDLGIASPGRARLLADNDRVRFVPARGWSGEVRLVYRAWDRTTIGGLALVAVLQNLFSRGDIVQSRLVLKTNSLCL